VKEHVAPISQVHSPFAQVPLHEEPAPQLTWQGGLSQEKLHEPF
jgi:hypothetical protein